MVARFVNGKSIRGVLHYNETKVATGEARLLLASGFAGDAAQFTFQQKLQRFEYLTAMNLKAKTNTVHISLNFAPQDKLNDEQLQQLSMAYMERIGFGEQPYLVYRHTDAAHIHVHIATVNVCTDGSRIDTHGIGWKLSEPARQQLEKEFGLVEAKGKTLSNQLGIKPADIEKAVYGQSLTKRAITNVVNAVIRDYRFTSLAEFNAVLRQFNLTAYRGAENTLMREKGGLLYSLVNAKGEPVGIPIKASAIYNKPTLKNLQREFAKNEKRRQVAKEPLQKAIEQTFGAYRSISRGTFAAELQKRNIHVVFRTNARGYLYGVTFVDNRYKAVFNGSDMGKDYSAKALLERFGATDQKFRQEQNIKTLSTTPATETTIGLPKISLARYQAQAAPTVPKKKKKKYGQDQDLSL